MTIGFRLYDALRRFSCLFFLVLGFEAFSSASTAHAEPNHAALEAVDDTEHLALMDEFIGLARRGDLDEMLDLMSPTVLRDARTAVKASFRDEVIPFFQDLAEIDPNLQTRNTAEDSGGLAQYGFAYFRLGVNPETGERRPFAVWLVKEEGRIVIGAVMVNRLLPQHTFSAIPENAGPPADGNWFPGMLSRVQVAPALPEGFVIVPLHSGETWDLSHGVGWCPLEAADWLRGSVEREEPGPRPQSPMVLVYLSTNVAQMRGADRFTVEEQMVELKRTDPEREVSVEKFKWGHFPVLAVSYIADDGLRVRRAWMGLNTDEGWTVELLCDLPEDHDDVFWRDLLAKTTSASTP